MFLIVPNAFQSECFYFLTQSEFLKIPEKLLIFDSEQNLCSSWLTSCGKWVGGHFVRNAIM